MRCCCLKSKKTKMPSTITKTLHLCFSKLKATTTAASQTPLTPPTGKLHSHQDVSTTLIKNFNSLYDAVEVTSPESDVETPSPVPDLTSVYASQRFFFSSPGLSNSIFDSSPEHPTPSSFPALVSGGGVAIPTYSPNPYMDFRLSMEEMVKARGLNVGADWDGLHELLLCYLALNRKCTHKFIIGAFLDLLVSLVAGDGRESELSGECTVSQG